MKRTVCIIISALMFLTFAACTNTQKDVSNDPTAAPSAVPTTEPTAEPTEKPTEEPTPEPTAIPVPKELSFTDCAELALRLPWGDGENEVFIHDPWVNADGDLEGGDWVIPEHFNIIGGKVYVYDRFYPRGNGLLECDPATGEVKRLSPDIGENDFFNGEFAVLNGKLIFGACMYDLETGEHTGLQLIPDTDYSGAGILIMSVRDGKCFAYRAAAYRLEGKDYFNRDMMKQATSAYDEYELDMENRMWVLTRRIVMPEYVPHAEPELGKDEQFFCCDRYMGMDDAGCHYVDSEEYVAYRPVDGKVEVHTWHRIIKLASDGTPISYVDVEFPDNYIHMWIDENYLVYKVDGDGTVWYMCETEDECLIYKINL